MRRIQKSGDEAECLVATCRSASPEFACPWRVDSQLVLNGVCRRVHAPHIFKRYGWLDLTHDRLQQRQVIQLLHLGNHGRGGITEFQVKTKRDPSSKPAARPFSIPSSSILVI